MIGRLVLLVVLNNLVINSEPIELCSLLKGIKLWLLRGLLHALIKLHGKVPNRDLADGV